MAGDEEAAASRTLEETSTWAVAVVTFVLIVISLVIEHSFHHLTKLFTRKRKSLNQALHKIKLELMVLGFISLLLTVSKTPISKICIPKSFGDDFLPCKDTTIPSDIVEESSCKDKGKISLLSKDGVDQVQMLIFTLALVHVLSCLLTFALGMAKMRRWKSWEDETKSIEYQVSNDPRRFILTHQTTFARRRLNLWCLHPILLWPVCFIRQFGQFGGSISKSDYFILRHGFITAHFSEANNFDFQKFLRRALDDDFQVVVGISLWIWTFSISFIFLIANGFYNHFWMPFLPLVVLLLIGTKLQVVITKMGMQSSNENTVVRGTLLVKPNDELFWFKRPQLLLHLIHCILFQNAFQLAFFAWTWYKFGLRSCFHKATEDIAIRISMGILVQLLCGYVTLPLYALVTQMGSSMNKAVFTDRVITGLKSWHNTAKRNMNNSNRTTPLPSPSYDRLVRTTSFSERGRNFLEMARFGSPSTEIGSPALAVAEITEHGDKVYSKRNNSTNNYNGEVSFGV